MMFAYVIKSEKDGRLYVGITSIIEKRVNEHNKGRTKSTKDINHGNCAIFKNWKQKKKRENEKNI